MDVRGSPLFDSQKVREVWDFHSLEVVVQEHNVLAKILERCKPFQTIHAMVGREADFDKFARVKAPNGFDMDPVVRAEEQDVVSLRDLSEKSLEVRPRNKRPFLLGAKIYNGTVDIEEKQGLPLPYL